VNPAKRVTPRAKNIATGPRANHVAITATAAAAVVAEAATIAAGVAAVAATAADAADTAAVGVTKVETANALDSQHVSPA
jgi:hypothetical protein